jgi:adenosine deaminase
VSLSFQTDNHLISCTNLNLEGQALVDEAGFSLSDLLTMQKMALDASFMPRQVIEHAGRRLQEWACSQGLQPATH